MAVLHNCLYLSNVYKICKKKCTKLNSRRGYLNIDKVINSMLIKKIKVLAAKKSDDIKKDRRYLHQNPELSFREFETAAYIKNELDKLDIPYTVMINTGIVAFVKGGILSDAVIALRADIDALPIQEQSNQEYASVHSGIMHACGHDVHTASLLGAARIMKDLQHEFAGTVKLIFQPAEEKYPGGAKAMIAAGALKNPAPDWVIGQHVMPELPAGKVGFRKGSYMASNDEIYISVKGRGGHGAQPQENIDPVTITAYIITALQQVVSRLANPSIPSVLSFGKIIANGATNIIPDEVYLEGTLRTVHEPWRKKAHQHIRNIAKSVAESMGASCDITIQGFPSVINDNELTDEIRTIAVEYLGAENVVDLDIWMAGEDFGEYAQCVPGCYYRLGVGNQEKGITALLHTPTFDIDEAPVYLVGSGLLAYAALKKLGN